MKKKVIKPYNLQDESINEVNEPSMEYYIPMKPPINKHASKELLIKDFIYEDFKAIANKAPLTLSDWADMLHISERTLHRYAKENTVFNGLQVELILLAEKLIDSGNYVFGKDGFKSWLNSAVFSLANRTPKELLNSYGGIQQVINAIGRIQHGISA